MQTFSANCAKDRFDELIDLAQLAPVHVVQHDQVVGVMVSVKDYEAMRAFYANRLDQTLSQIGTVASAAGLTEARLDQLLVDES